MEKFKYLDKSRAAKLPKAAGVYSFRSGKKILYIGKAGNIKERVKNHFQQSSWRDNLFVNKVKKIGYIKTDSEIEALILEAKLIKKRQPDYNIVWKDDKNYFYVGFTKEDFPRIFITHQPKTSQTGPKYLLKNNKLIKDASARLSASYIGPFVKGRALKQTLAILRRVFPYRSYRFMPKRPCLWYQMGRCPGPCLLNSSLAEQIPKTGEKIKKECRRNAENLQKILRGEKIKTIKELNKEMKTLAKEEKFEEAGKIKEQVWALEKVFAHARVFGLAETDELLPVKNWPYQRAEAYDISNIQGQQAAGAMAVFEEGRPEKSQYRKFKIKMENKPDDVAMIKEVLWRRFAHQEWPYPDFILIDGGKAQLNAAKQVLLKQKKLGQIKTAALAKKKNELFMDDRKNPVLLKNMPREFSNTILQMRDEAHRFAIKYHHQLRETELKNN